MLGSKTITLGPRSGAAAAAPPLKTSAVSASAKTAATTLDEYLATGNSFLDLKAPPPRCPGSRDPTPGHARPTTVCRPQKPRSPAVVRFPRAVPSDRIGTVRLQTRHTFPGTLIAGEEVRRTPGRPPPGPFGHVRFGRSGGLRDRFGRRLRDVADELPGELVQEPPDLLVLVRIPAGEQVAQPLAAGGDQAFERG